MEQPTTPKKKAPAWFMLLLLAVFAFVFYRACIAEGEPAPPTQEELMNESVRKEMLPGLDPYAVVEALEQQGMVATKSHMKGGTSYTFKGGIDGTELQVNMTIWRFGTDAMASGIHGMAMVGYNQDIEAARPFFGYLVSLQYDGAEPARAKEWAEANYDADSAVIIIGEAHFLLKATSPGSRILNIRHAMPYDPQAQKK